MSETGQLSVERRGQVALVTLERPEKRNALSIELRTELADAFTGLSDDDAIGCVVLTGAGSAFCSGMDTSQFGGDLANRERLVRRLRRCRGRRGRGKLRKGHVDRGRWRQRRRALGEGGVNERARGSTSTLR